MEVAVASDSTYGSGIARIAFLRKTVQSPISKARCSDVSGRGTGWLVDALHGAIPPTAVVFTGPASVAVPLDPLHVSEARQVC